MKVRRVVTAVALLVLVSACSSSPQESGSDRLRHDVDARARAASMLQQFEIDTGWIGPDRLRALNCVDPDGTLRDCLALKAWFSGRGGYVTGPSSHVAADDAEEHMAALMHHIPALKTTLATPAGPTLSPEQGADAVVIQELVDAGYLHARDFGADADGVVTPGPAAERWIGAHSRQPLCHGARPTVGVETERVLAWIVDPTSARLA